MRKGAREMQRAAFLPPDTQTAVKTFLPAGPRVVVRVMGEDKDERSRAYPGSPRGGLFLYETSQSDEWKSLTLEDADSGLEHVSFPLHPRRETCKPSLINHFVPPPNVI